MTQAIIITHMNISQNSSGICIAESLLQPSGGIWEKVPVSLKSQTMSFVVALLTASAKSPT